MCPNFQGVERILDRLAERPSEQHAVERLWHNGSSPAATYPIIERSDGCRVWDDGGAEYIDANAGLRNVIAGHNRDRIIDAIADQLSTLDFYPVYKYGHEPAATLAALLTELLLAEPTGSRVFYSTGGAESIETAIKIARQYQSLRGSNARTVLYFEGAYHGSTYGALSAGATDWEREQYGPFPDGFVSVPVPECGDGCAYEAGDCERGCLDAVRDAVRSVGEENVAALVATPFFRTDGRYVFPSESFVTELRALTRQHDILLVADEISSSLGRTGELLGFDHYGVEPDVVCLSKGLANGHFPLAATVVGARVVEPFLDAGADLYHGHTFAGHPAACRAAVATLRLLEREQAVQNAREVGDRLVADLRANLAGVEGVRVGGRGMFVWIELTGPRDDYSALYEHVRANGVLCKYGGPLGLFPPVVMDEDTATDLAERLGSAVSAYLSA